MTAEAKHNKYHKRKPSLKGKDLSYIFYGLTLFFYIFTTFQFCVYNSFAFKETSVFYPFIRDWFGWWIDMSGSPLQVFNGIPLDIFINIMIGATTIYGVGEGSTSLIQSMGMKNGLSAPMPEYKLKRFLGFLILWAFLSFVVTVYQTGVKPIDFRSGVTFNVGNVYTGLLASVSTYFYSRLAPKVGESVDGKKDAVVTDPTPTPPVHPAAVGGG